MIAHDFKTQILPVSKKLMRFATLFLNDEELARDAVQDVFLKLWQKKESLAQVENIEAYAMRMTRNRCLDIVRTQKTVAFNAETDRKLKNQTVDVHSKVEFSEAANQIRTIIGTLPDLQRQIIQLRDIEQLSYEEIAEVTKLKINTIRVNLSRARKKVRDKFLKMNEDEDRRSKTFAAPLL